MFNNKKAFTLLEMIVVIIILAFMIWIFGYFTVNNSNEKEQKDFWTNAAKDIYNHIKTSNNKIIRNYTNIFSWETKPIQSIIISAEALDKADILNITEVYDSVSWYNISLELKYSDHKYINKIKNLWTWSSAIIINKNNIFKDNYAIETQSCTKSDNVCLPISQINFNKAASTTNQKFCAEFSWSICKQWK
jgi:prepilin-type N-terminal cleavage/methylation domain-containing protein